MVFLNFVFLGAWRTEVQTIPDLAKFFVKEASLIHVSYGFIIHSSAPDVRVLHVRVISDKRLANIVMMISTVFLKCSRAVGSCFGEWCGHATRFLLVLVLRHTGVCQCDP